MCCRHLTAILNLVTNHAWSLFVLFVSADRARESERAEFSGHLQHSDRARMLAFVRHASFTPAH